MEPAALRALQAPLKTRYRQDPASALEVPEASGELDLANIACRVATRNGTVVAGLHPATGGDGTMVCSADMLLQALVACEGVTLAAVATAMGLAITRGRIRAEADWDVRGTLGVSKTAPVGLTAIRVVFELETGATDQQLETLLSLTERYCVVQQTLAIPAPLTRRLERLGAG